jgi:hypothetical protein
MPSDIAFVALAAVLFGIFSLADMLAGQVAARITGYVRQRKEQR